MKKFFCSLVLGLSVISMARAQDQIESYNYDDEVTADQMDQYQEEQDLQDQVAVLPGTADINAPRGGGGGHRGGGRGGPGMGRAPGRGGGPRMQPRAPRTPRGPGGGWNRGRAGGHGDWRHHGQWNPRGGWHSGQWAPHRGWNDGWRHNWGWRPNWWRASVIFPTWYWIDDIPSGYWQCTAFNSSLQPFADAGVSRDQAAYDALYSCGGAGWENAGCYIPENYCQYRP